MSVNKPTQKYSRPPIKEAVFDLQTRNKEVFNYQLFKKFLGQFTEYSIHEPLSNINIDTKNMTQKTEVFGYRCISKDRKQIIQFKQNGFSFIRLEIYDGWDKNYKEALKLWKEYCEVMKPEVITRVATRFINKFKISHVFTKPKEYFNTYIHYDKSISPAWNKMTYRLLLSHTNGIKSHVIFDNIVNQGNQTVDILFDIDVFSDNLGLLHTDVVALENLFNQLRKIKNEVFEKGVTDKIRGMIQ